MSPVSVLVVVTPRREVLPLDSLAAERLMINVYAGIQNGHDDTGAGERALRCTYGVDAPRRCGSDRGYRIA
jgi:hypothetical protein